MLRWKRGLRIFYESHISNGLNEKYRDPLLNPHINLSTFTQRMVSLGIVDLEDGFGFATLYLGVPEKERI